MSRMTENEYFRFYICKLDVKTTAELCFKSVTTVKGWDKGRPIPPECKRLMKMHAKRSLSETTEWEGFSMVGNKLQAPNLKQYTPRQLISSLALLEINAPYDQQTKKDLLKYARILAKLKD